MVKISDFGVASWIQEVTLTMNEILGNRGYIPHEAYVGAPDWRADQHALGITSFERVAGRRPPDVERPTKVVPAPPSRAVPGRSARHLQRALEQIA